MSGKAQGDADVADMQPATLLRALPMPALLLEEDQQTPNTALTRLLGPAAGNWLAAVPARDAQAARNAWESGLTRGHPFSLALQLVRPDGRPRPMRLEASPLAGDRWLVSFYEVAANIPVQLPVPLGGVPQCPRSGLWDCHNLQALFHVLQDPVFVVDPGGTIVRWNEAAPAALGLTAQELHRLDFAQLFPDGSREAQRPTLAALLARTCERATATLQGAGGRALHVDITCGWPREDVLGCAFIVCHDVTEHHVREEALTLSEARFRGIVAGIDEGLCLVDDEFRIKMHNPRLASLLGEADGDLVGRSVLDFVAPQDRARLAARAGSNGTGARQADVRLLRSDGRRGWAEFAWLPRQQCPQGESCQMLTFSDVSARKEAEEQVRLQHRFVNQVLNTLPMGVMVQQARPGGGITLWNRQMEQTFGVLARDAVGQPLAALLPPHTIDALIEAVDAETSPQEPRTLDDMPMAGADGAAFIARVTIAPISGGRGAQRSLLVILNDVTERFRAEAEQRRLSETLARREQNYRLLADKATDLITRHDARGVVLFASHASIRLFGLTPAQMEGRHPLKHVHPSDRPLLLRFLKRLKERSGPAVLSYRIIRLDGRVTWVETSAEQSEDAAGMQITCVTRDINERRRAEDELLQVQRQLTDAVESMESGLAMYDADDRLVLCNNRYRSFIPAAAHAIRPGAKYESIIDAMIEAGVAEAAGLSPDELRRMRLNEHRTAHGDRRVQRIGADRWVQVTDLPTSEGGVVSLITDVTQIKQVETELNRQRTMLATLLDSIPDLIFYKDKEGVYLLANPAFCSFVGRKRESVVGRTDFDIFPQDVATFFREYDRLAIEARAQRRNEEWVAYPDGRLVLLDTLKQPMLQGDEVQGLVGISRDITERHRAETLLRAESSRLATLIQSMEGGVLVEDENRNVRLVNRVFLRLFEIPGEPEDVVGVDCAGLLRMAAPLFAHPDEVVQGISTLIESNTPARSMILEMRGNRFIECDFTPIAIGAHTHNYLWHYRDITQRRRAEIELQQRDVMLRGLADTVRQLLAGLDDFDAGVIEAFRIIAETAQVDCVRIFELHAHPDDPSIRCSSQRYIWSRFQGAGFSNPLLTNVPTIDRWDSELARGNVIVGRTKDFHGQERKLFEAQQVGAAFIAPLAFDDGLWGAIAFDTRREREFTAVDQNILRMVADSVGYALQRKRSRDELNAALSEAEQARKATSDFLASMSHEIRTPLNGLVGYMNLLRNTRLTRRQHYLLGGVDRSSEILLALINDILDLSKISAGQFGLDTEPFSPERVATDVMEALRPKADEKGLMLAFVPGELPPHPFVGDPRRLKQVLLNLLGNAIKFTATGGITLSASAVAPESPEEPWSVHFQVADTGIGIAQEAQSRLFQPFSQAGADISRRFGGTGLGLAICRELVTLMGGTIGVESEAGKGSTFSFHVLCPAAEAPLPRETEPETGQPRPVASDVPIEILIADDNVINQEVLSLYLEDMGYEPKIVEDGVAAVEAVKQAHIDLIFMDLRMPNMDGRDATRAIREWEATQPGRTPVSIIALTADSLKSDQDSCAALGMNDYVTKPIEPEKIELLIRKHCGARPDHPADPGL